MNQNRVSISLMVIALTLASCAAPQASAQEPQPGKITRDVVPQLTVRGEAQLEKPADQMHLRLGVVTQATEAAQAMQENNRTMQAIIGAIEKLGLTNKEYSTGRFNVQPQYAPPPRNPQPDWRPKITGYQVTNTLHIKTKKLEKAGDLIQAATDAGANNVESIYFDLADQRTHRAEAIAEATRNAMSDAQALANASGQKLVRVISISLDGANGPQPMYREVAMERGMMAMDGSAAPPINPGDITVHANVTIVYEIAPAN